MSDFLGFLRYVVSTAALTASAPVYNLVWAVWRGVALLLPAWLYQWGDDKCYSLYQRLVLFFFEHCTNLKVYLSGDADLIAKKERVLYIGNHQSTVDWIICNMLAVRTGSLGHLRYVMKDQLQMLPLYGHYFYQHGCIYVKRSQFNASKMVSCLQYLQNPRIPSWVVIFPEGTRFIPENSALLERSNKMAQDAGRTELRHHLTPRSKGTFLTLSYLRDHLDAVYDVTTVFAGTKNQAGQRVKAPQLVDLLRGKCPALHLHVKRIPIGNIPKDESDFQDWMHERFVEKDKIMAKFYETESSSLDVSQRGLLSRLPLFATLPSFVFFATAALPFILLPAGPAWYLKSIVYGILGGYAWLAIKAVC